MAIKAVIFDCFGVLCVGSLDRLYDMAGENWQDVQDISRAANHGFISRKDFFEQVAPIVNMTANELSDFVENIHAKDSRMVEYVKNVKKSYKTALLSNISDSAIDELFSRDEQCELFDAVVTSSSLGYCKPDAKIYHHTADLLNVLPEECIMVDDMSMNVDGAEKAGMQGVLFTGFHAGSSKIDEVLNA